MGGANGLPALARGALNRAPGWIVVGLVALGWIVLRDVSGLLGHVENAGGRAYDASTFNGFKFNPLDVDQMRSALALWQGPAQGGDADRPALVKHLLNWYLAVDSFVFTPAYAALFGLVLRGVGVRRPFWFAAAIFAVDSLENIVTWFVIRDLNAGTHSIQVIQCLSLAKWLIAGGSVIPIVVAFFNTEDDTWNASDAWLAVRSGGTGQHLLNAVPGLFVVVILFVGFAAVPAVGALDQVPDALRYQIDELSNGRPWPFIFSTLALFLLAGAVMIAGLVATDPSNAPPAGDRLSTPEVLWFAFLGSAVLVLLTCIVGEAPKTLVQPPLALFYVVAVLTVAYWVARFAKVGSKGIDDAPPVAEGAQRTTETTLWIGGLSGLVLMGGGIGLVRAAVPPFVTSLDSDIFPWWSYALLGGVITVLAGPIAQAVVQGFEAFRETSNQNKFWRRLAIVVSGVVVIIAGRLTYAPEAARLFGVTGVAAMCMALFALGVGALAWCGRWLPQWPAARYLGLGYRMPLLFLLVVVWCVASGLNTKGGYHDIRIVANREASTSTHGSIATAFHEWLEVQKHPFDPACKIGDEPVPLVLVATPGGGIRAAYWTELGLDRLFGPGAGACGRSRLFAISGVSGGAMGATTWIAADTKAASIPAESDTSVRPPGALAIDADAALAYEDMADDEPLSSAIAGLLLRDLLQPLTGIDKQWRDRSALLEDGWIKKSHQILGDTETPLLWNEVDATNDAWTPVIILNGSSAGDGCRVLVTNTGDLPANSGANCFVAPSSDTAPMGPITGSIDLLSGCALRQTRPTTLGGVRAATAALLAARFPIISSSGGLRRCIPGESKKTSTYTVDGGYYENSGLLTILQVWAALAPSVREECALTEADRLCVEPWIVVLDNKYQSNAQAPDPPRPYEVAIPLQTRGKNGILSDNSLQQMAAWETAIGSRRCVVERSVLLDDDTGKVISDFANPICSNFVRLGLTVRPAVSAPLGWVLSEASRDDLRQQMEAAMDPCRTRGLLVLLDQLNPPREPRGACVLTWLAPTIR